MPILRERVSWSIPRRTRASDLTPDEQTNARRAMRALVARYGSNKGLAVAMGASVSTVAHAIGKGAVSAALAVQVARAANVPVSDVLAGRFPKPGACLLCGHVTRQRKDGKVSHA